MSYYGNFCPPSSAWIMNYTKTQLWERFQKLYFDFPAASLALDLSRLNLSDDFFRSMQPRMQQAFEEMAALEQGAVANPDENRMVGHYWLRNPALAPTPEITREIQDTVAAIKQFAADVHKGLIAGPQGPFKHLLLIGIGGSALGPQFVSRALGQPGKDKMSLFCFDNTDPEGFDTILAAIGAELNATLCVVVSKSGGTKETRNGMLEAIAAFTAAGLNFPRHAVAVTSKGSELDKFAVQNSWLQRFPMWDWVGGRTSEMSAVGLLPAALQGLDIDGLLRGAKLCDEVTRTADINKNPAALLALAWYHCGNGKGDKTMVVLPYKDRLELFSRYLQQLVMESLGKRADKQGKVVHQGISVFGNKGSTDQHAFVQQLRDGLNNFFVTFIQVLKDRASGRVFEVEPGVTSGDYLDSFYLGTRQALFEDGRESITITLPDVTPVTVGALIAVFERAVGFYATLVNVNAYHQPGVEAGKKAATDLIVLEKKLMAFFKANPGKPLTPAAIAQEMGCADEAETVFKLCEHLAANGRGVTQAGGQGPGSLYQGR